MVECDIKQKGRKKEIPERETLLVPRVLVCAKYRGTGKKSRTGLVSFFRYNGSTSGSDWVVHSTWPFQLLSDRERS